MIAKYQDIISDLKKKLYHPVYFLCGEEPYYIDKLSRYMEENILTENEREFNQHVFYGRDSTLSLILDTAYRFPMMSNYQLIIVKEAQEMEKSILGDEDNPSLLLNYLKKPQNTTILVFCYKYRKIDLRTTVGKKITVEGLFFDSKKLYDNQIPAWIENYVRAKGYAIGHKALAILTEYLGNDLSKIAGEVDKLMLNIPVDSEITVVEIERNIGISKDYNIFELQAALGIRNEYKAIQIVNHFASNHKDNPLLLTTAMLYSYFSKLLIFHFLKDKSSGNVAASLGINPYFVNEYTQAARTWNLHSLKRAFSVLKEYDLKAKGMGNVSADEAELYKEFIFKLLNPNIKTQFEEEMSLMS